MPRNRIGNQKYDSKAKWSLASHAARSDYYKKKKIQENVKEGRGDQFQTKQNSNLRRHYHFYFFFWIFVFFVLSIIINDVD